MVSLGAAVGTVLRSTHWLKDAEQGLVIDRYERGYSPGCGLFRASPRKPFPFRVFPAVRGVQRDQDSSAIHGGPRNNTGILNSSHALIISRTDCLANGIPGALFWG